MYNTPIEALSVQETRLKMACRYLLLNQLCETYCGMYQNVSTSPFQAGSYFLKGLGQFLAESTDSPFFKKNYW